jgi:hypothetical protein
MKRADNLCQRNRSSGGYKGIHAFVPVHCSAPSFDTYSNHKPAIQRVELLRDEPLQLFLHGLDWLADVPDSVDSAPS